MRILHTCDRFLRMWKSNGSVTSVKKAISFTRDPPKYKFGGSNWAWPPSPQTAWRPVVTDREAGNRNAKFHHLTRIQLDIEASLIGKFHSFLRNKKKQIWPTAAMIFDRLDFGFGFCTTRHWGEHSNQYLKKSDQWSWRRCDIQCVNGKFVPAGNQTAKMEFFLYFHN